MNGQVYQTLVILILLFSNNIKMIDIIIIINMTINFFIGYDAKEDIAYRVCKYSLIKRASKK